MFSRHVQVSAVRAGVLQSLLAASALLAAAPLEAQTDYYNTDRRRPIQIEDAYATERYAFELKLAPVRLERARGGFYQWAIEPEIAYGILPRTHVELGVPLAHTDLGAGSQRSGLAGIDLSLMHNLNVETRTLPAFAVRADVLAPVGGLAPDHAYTSLTAMATRTYSWMRVHANAQVGFGAAPGDAGFASNDAFGPGTMEQSRWLAGVAADRTFPLRSMLLTAEVFARQPIAAGERVEYSAGGGIRYQWSPRLALDAGVGRRLTGGDASAGVWYVTFGTAYAFALRSMIPGGRQ
jgi:hypothetical protein